MPQDSSDNHHAVSQSSTAAAAGSIVSVEPDTDGAYTNPAIPDSVNPDSVEVVRVRQSTNSARQRTRVYLFIC